MNPRTRHLLLALSLCLASLQCQAQERHGFHQGWNMRHDGRFQHNHYYPVPGQVVPGLAYGNVMVRFNGQPFYFQGGYWLRPYNGRYLVVTPPLGIVVPILPPQSVTLMMGGLVYFYANGTYYSPLAGRGYVVVPPPARIEQAQVLPPGVPLPLSPPIGLPQPLYPSPAPMVTAPVVPAPVVTAPASAEPIIYPRQGQSAEQRQSDQAECQRWALSQPNASQDPSIRARGFDACMDARGYTVR